MVRIASVTTEIILHEFYETCKSDKSLFPTNSEFKLWCEDINSNNYELFKHGTLSIGFIGLTETIEILFGDKYWKNEKLSQIRSKFCWL